VRLLVATTAFPLPERDGLDVLTAGLLRELRQRHEIALVAMVADDSDLARHGELCSELIPVRAPRSGLWARVHQEVSTLPNGRPVLAEQATEALMRPFLRAIDEFRPDIIHLIQSWTAELAAAAPGYPSVLSALDASGPNWDARIQQRTGRLRRYLGRRERSRMLRYERDCYPAVDRVVLVTEEDSELVRTTSPRSRVATVTNGINADHWRRPKDLPREDGLIVFTGNLTYAPNISAALFAAREIMPIIRETNRNARLRLVGRDPAPQLMALDGEYVEVTGTVPDLRPHLWSASAYMCPMTEGSGVKNKLLEAMAAGCPCVATPRAAFGLDVINNQHVLFGDDAAALARQAARVLGDKRLSEALTDASLSRIEELSWAAAARSYERIYAEIVAERSMGSEPPQMRPPGT
jgi:glycosyltransferase involved in cell wall biosynthesis